MGKKEQKYIAIQKEQIYKIYIEIKRNKYTKYI